MFIFAAGDRLVVVIAVVVVANGVSFVGANVVVVQHWYLRHLDVNISFIIIIIIVIVVVVTSFLGVVVHIGVHPFQLRR